MASTTVSSEPNDKVSCFCHCLWKETWVIWWGSIDVKEWKFSWTFRWFMRKMGLHVRNGDYNGKLITRISTNNPEILACGKILRILVHREIREWETDVLTLFPNLCQAHTMDLWSIFSGFLLHLACISDFDLGLFSQAYPPPLSQLPSFSLASSISWSLSSAWVSSFCPPGVGACG